MTQPYAGGCACGTIRYETRHAPIFQNHCQCRDCRRRSGTGHGSYLTFPARAEMAISGEATQWQVAAGGPGRRSRKIPDHHKPTGMPWTSRRSSSASPSRPAC
jgi:hypothetical protein